MAAKGAFASSILMISASWIIKSIGLISSVILARLLTPEDFGLVAICMLVIYFFDILATTGTRTYILSLTDVTEQDINSAWTLDFCAKLTIAIVVAILSPHIAIFFEKSQLAIPIAVCTFIPLINSLENPKLNLLRRKLEYGIIVRIRIVAKILGFIVSVSLAFYLRSYWALIIGSLIVSVIITGLGYVLCPYVPKFDLSRCRLQWNFSKWIFLKAFLGYGRSKFDTYILAKFFSLYEVGLFNIAKELGFLVYELIAMPLCDIVISDVKQAGAETERISKAIEHHLVFFVSIILPASVGMYALSDEIVFILLGDKWATAGSLLKPLSIFGFFIGIIAVLSAVMNAIRKVKVTFYLELVAFIVAIGIIYSCREYEIQFFTTMVASTGLVTLICYLAITYYYTGISVANLLFAMVPAILASNIMLFALFQLKQYQGSTVLVLLFNIGCGIITYLGCFYILLILMAGKSSALAMIKVKVDEVQQQVIAKVTNID